MYTPAHFAIDDPSLVAEIIDQNPFAPLITPHAGGVSVTHTPLLLDKSRGKFGVLSGHMAVQNDHWKAFESAGESLVIFIGPHCYVSPTWYRDEQSVPTWNYATVHAYGQAAILDESRSVKFLLGCWSVSSRPRPAVMITPPGLRMLGRRSVASWLSRLRSRASRASSS